MSHTNSDAQAPKTVVVVGAGFAGMSAMRRMRGNHNLKITLIDENPAFVYAPGLWEFDHVADPEEQIGIDLRDYAHAHHIEFIHDKVERIDTEKRTIACGKQHLAYDYLVISPGAKTNFYGIPGLEEHSLTLKGFSDFRRIKEALTGIVLQHQERSRQEPSDGGAQSPLAIIVGGGGLAGIDTAMGCHDYITLLTRTHTISPGFTITIIEGNDSIMTGFNRKAIAKVKKGLEKRGITIRENTRITGVERNKDLATNALTIKTSDNNVVNASLLIWTGGVSPNACVQDAGLTITPRKCVMVNSFLQAEGKPEVFVAGDIAHIESKSGGKQLPMNAHWAMSAGLHAGKNITLLSQHKKMKPFVPKHDAPVIVGLGGHDAVLFWGDFVFEGHIAEWIRKSIRIFVLWYLR